MSFLQGAPCCVIHNGIDTNIFKPSANTSTTNEKFKLLGVASEWTPRKGLQDFIKLFKMFDPQKVEITVVGLTEKQIQSLPEGINGMKRTDNVEQLVKLYQDADLFFNPTYEDNYPTTNIEAIACGTPVCTYDTGGSIESVNESNGFVVKKSDLRTVKQIIESNLHTKKMGLQLKTNIQTFSQETMAEQYVKLYNDILL